MRTCSAACAVLEEGTAHDRGLQASEPLDLPRDFRVGSRRPLSPEVLGLSKSPERSWRGRRTRGYSEFKTPT